MISSLQRASWLTPNQIAAWCVIGPIVLLMAWHRYCATWLKQLLKRRRAEREQATRDYQDRLDYVSQQNRIREEMVEKARFVAEFEARLAAPAYDQDRQAKQ